MTVAEHSILQCMLAQDPALRWQVERDLLGAPVEVWSAIWARVQDAASGHLARTRSNSQMKSSIAGRLSLGIETF